MSNYESEAPIKPPEKKKNTARKLVATVLATALGWAGIMANRDRDARQSEQIVPAAGAPTQVETALPTVAPSSPVMEVQLSPQPPAPEPVELTTVPPTALPQETATPSVTPDTSWTPDVPRPPVTPSN